LLLRQVRISEIENLPARRFLGTGIGGLFQALLDGVELRIRQGRTLRSPDHCSQNSGLDCCVLHLHMSLSIPVSEIAEIDR